MSAPPSIYELIDKFRADSPHIFVGGDTGSRHICREFIDPILKCLGWETGQSEGCTKRDTGITRDIPFRIGGRMKYIDYVLCTRRGGVCAVMIANPSPDGGTALDLRRYAWNAGLHLAILTNFAESIVYDATIPVHCGDDATTALIATIPIDRYAEQWDRIAALISRECVLQGSIGLFLSERRGIEGAAGVGAVLRSEFEEWRLLLAKRIALRNHGLSSDAINEVVQYILTRILFLRIVEDRGIGQYGSLMRVTEGGSAWGRLCGLFRFAEDEYGGGLFRFTERTGTEEPTDALMLTLAIDDEVMKKVITRLSPPQSPYEFSVIPARVLAEVFSPFLGSVIRLTTGYHAVVEVRPEIRKAGGPSCTPQEVAGYIVGRTLSELVKGKTPRDIADLPVLDPACGSGLFLVMAYEFLLDWHLEWYKENLVPAIRGGDYSPENIRDLLPGLSEESDADNALPVICCKGREGDTSREGVNWKLAPGEKTRILLTTIFGVDIDRRAVETTRLLLLVTRIEDMDQVGLPLPDLSGTIRCGNSIVGPDIFDDPDASLIDPRSRERLRVFDWEAAFPGIMASEGFSAVTGHLPMFRRESLKWEKEYLEKRYTTLPGTPDLYHCFVEKGISLLRPGGLFSAIFPDEWLRADNGTKLRMFLGGFAIREIIDFSDPGARRGDLLQPCIIRVAKEAPGASLSLVRGEIPETGSFEDHLETHRYTVLWSRIGQGSWILPDTRVQNLVMKVRNIGTPLGEYVMGGVYRGIRIDPRSALLIDNETKKRLIAQDPEAVAIIRPFLSEEGLRRYLPPEAKNYLIVVQHGTDMKKYPAVYRHLLHQKRETVQRKSDRRGGGEERIKSDAHRWYELPDTGISPDLFAKPKIVFPGIAKEGRFTLDTSGHYCPDTCRILSSSSLYLLGLLNSRLIWFIIRQTLPTSHGDYRTLYGRHFENIPVFVPDFDDVSDKSRYDSLEALVQQMLKVQKRSAEANDIGDKTMYRQQITELDRRIDAIVYDLYRLTSEEIMTVEKDRTSQATSC